MNADEQTAIEVLRSPATIRARCGRILTAAEAGETRHFSVHLDQLGAVADRVAQCTRTHYPTLQIPPHGRWSHFRIGGVDRPARLEALLAQRDERERGRARLELAVLSVLLDAGAGAAWRYTDPHDGQSYTRSEGLAVASFDMYCQGQLPTTAATLGAVRDADLARGFQVGPDNPLVGLSGRAELLRGLGAALTAHPTLFGEPARLGHLFDALHDRARGGRLPAREILHALLIGLGEIWPGRLRLAGQNLGDVWRHPHAGGDGASAGLVPFHKLSQWLTYSLIEPLSLSGIEVGELDELTALAEYRNGGLLIDLGALAARRAELLREPQPADSEAIVEWRALTVALVDRLAPLVRERLGRSAPLGGERLRVEALPLPSILEGGTWRAGREVARERRPDGSPPIQLASDGTVF